MSIYLGLDKKTKDEIRIPWKDINGVSIVGRCGSGKSVYLKNIINDFLQKAEFNKQVIVVDYKAYEYNEYKGNKDVKIYTHKNGDEFFQFLLSISKSNEISKNKTLIIIDEYIDFVFAFLDKGIVDIFNNLIKTACKRGYFFVFSSQRLHQECPFIMDINVKICTGITSEKEFYKYMQTTDYNETKLGDMIIKMPNGSLIETCSPMDYFK